MPRLHVDNEEDVVHGDGGDEVHQEPGAEVMDTDLFGVQNNVAVLSQDSSAEVEKQIHEEDGVRHDVEDDPGQSVLIFKEGDSPGEDDQVAHHQQEHHYVPVEPGHNRTDGSDIRTSLFINYHLCVHLTRCCVVASFN